MDLSQIQTPQMLMAAFAIVALLSFTKKILVVVWPVEERSDKMRAGIGLFYEALTIVAGALAGGFGFLEKSGDLKTGLVAGVALSLTIGKLFDVSRKTTNALKPRRLGQ